MKKRCVREREDDYRNTIMPGGQDPALLMIRCSVCICARRREDDNSVLIALVRETYEVIFVVLATCVPSPHCLVPPTCALIFICVSLSLSVSWQSLIHLHFATSRPLLPSFSGSKERGTMAQLRRVLHHSLYRSLFLYQKWESRGTTNGRKRKRNKKNAYAEGRSGRKGAQVNERARVTTEEDEALERGRLRRTCKGGRVGERKRRGAGGRDARTCVRREREGGNPKHEAKSVVLGGGARRRPYCRISRGERTIRESAVKLLGLVGPRPKRSKYHLLFQTKLVNPSRFI